MVERLPRAFQQLDELSPAAQLDLAQQIEDLTDPHDEVAALQETAPPRARCCCCTPATIGACCAGVRRCME